MDQSILNIHIKDHLVNKLNGYKWIYTVLKHNNDQQIHVRQKYFWLQLENKREETGKLILI